MERYIVFFIIVFLLFAVGLIGSTAYLLVRCTQLGFYARKAKYERWAELTSVGRFGPGAWNSMRWLRYVYSAADNDDPVIARLKGRIRVGLRQSLAMLLACVVVIGILAILAHMDK